jgi:hypothetical protein
VSGFDESVSPVRGWPGLCTFPSPRSRFALPPTSAPPTHPSRGPHPRARPGAPSKIARNLGSSGLAPLLDPEHIVSAAYVRRGKPVRAHAVMRARPCFPGRLRPSR